MSKWIRVEDRLPDNDVKIIGWIAPYGVVKNGIAELVVYENKNFYDAAWRTCTVTHWMTLPKEPE